MKATLRPATASDASRVASLLIDTRSAFMPYAPSAHAEAEVRDWVASHLLPTGGVTVAVVDGRVMGTMATERNGQVSWITQMAVDPSWVGQGIGSLLLGHAVRTLAPPLRLYTFQANVGARKFVSAMASSPSNSRMAKPTRSVARTFCSSCEPQAKTPTVSRRRP
jgi:GNAT superfamily N-acetyltransferase